MLYDLLSSPTEFKNNKEYMSLPDIKNSVYATDEFRMYILSHRGRNPMFLLCIYLVAIYSQAGLDLLSTQDMFIRMSSIYVVGDYEQEQLLNDFYSSLSFSLTTTTGGGVLQMVNVIGE